MNFSKRQIEQEVDLANGVSYFKARVLPTRLTCLVYVIDAGVQNKDEV